MKALHALPGLAMVGLATAISASGQIAGSSSVQAPVPAVDTTARAISVPSSTPAVQLLQSFRESDVKFDVVHLMSLLRDRNHEGWVLAAYPDPKTGQPLIGAGVSIDLPAREHPQRDPLNPNQFIEPASAELWQAARLEPERLNRILDDFHQKLALWDMREYRGHIRELPSQITEEEATELLRMATIQSIVNAKAYCRSFDRLTASQQMALSQLVFQMGMNLEEFTTFLDLINSDAIAAPIATKAAGDVTYWNGVQKSLIQSQWARLYRARAVSVIAMLDPRYNQNPRMAERRVGAVLRPAVIHRRRGRSGSTQLASATGSTRRHAGKRSSHAHSKRRA
jgi:GH24 family phage-related lysozyme (muramidase)